MYVEDNEYDKEELESRIHELEKELDSSETHAADLGCLVLILGIALAGSWGWFYF